MPTRKRIRPTVVDKHVSKSIQTYREAGRLTQSDLADKLKCTAQTVSKYETAASFVTVSRLHQIAQILLRPIQEFFPIPLISYQPVTPENILLAQKIDQAPKPTRAAILLLLNGENGNTPAIEASEGEPERRTDNE